MVAKATPCGRATMAPMQPAIKSALTVRGVTTGHHSKNGRNRVKFSFLMITAALLAKVHLAAVSSISIVRFSLFINISKCSRTTAGCLRPPAEGRTNVRGNNENSSGQRFFRSQIPFSSAIKAGFFPEGRMVNGTPGGLYFIRNPRYPG